MSKPENPEDAPVELVKLKPSNDWLATFYCSNCSTYHHMLLLKQRVHFKAFLIENAKAHKDVVKPFGTYKSMGGAPDDKIIDDIEDQFGPPDDEDDDEDDEDDE
jgi:hypothetical protein